jgi:hypothetical protein
MKSACYVPAAHAKGLAHRLARRQLFEHVRPEAFLELGDASQHG